MRSFTGFLAILTAVAAFPQQTQPVKEFEVTSVRVVPELTMDQRMHDPRSRLPSITPSEARFPYASMKDLLLRAFDVSPTQLFGPDWITSDHYSVQAKLPAGTPSRDVPEMLKNMLASRFGLKYHTETQSLPTAVLTVKKGGLKARPATPADERSFRNLQEPAATHNELPLTTEELAEFLTGLIGAPVRNETGANGRYMFVYDVYPFGRGDPNPNGFGHPVFMVDRYDEALAPLGLHLEYKKAPLETVIIDSLSREPNEN